MSAKVSIIDGQAFVTLNGATLPAVDAILILRERQAEAYEAMNKSKNMLVAAEREHGAVLADGAEPDRDILTAAKTDIDRSQKTVKAIENDLSRVHEEIIDHEASGMVDAAAAEIEKDTGTKPDLNESLARNVAELQLRLGVAEAEHKAALGEVEKAQTRVNDIDRRIGEITKKRLAGDATAGSAEELTALAFDIKSLREVMGQANQKASSLDPSDLRAQHSRAISEWDKHVGDARLAALAAVARDREEDFIKALSALGQAAGDAGVHNLGDVWRPSDPLRSFVTRTLVSAMPKVAA